MTEPTEFALLEIATAYALHAVSDAERRAIEHQVAAAPAPVADAFDDQVRAVRETLAIVSATTATEPPAQLRAAVLAGAETGRTSNRRWRTAVFAAAAIVLGLTAFGVGIALRPSTPPTVAEQVLVAPDVRTVSVPLHAGTATMVFSRDRGAGVLVMNNVPPPAPGSVYQMWLIGAGPPTSVGTMDTKAVAPSTTAMISGLRDSAALALSLEPGSGSPQPTGPIFAELPLR